MIGWNVDCREERVMMKWRGCEDMRR